MTKQEKQDQAEAITKLREWLKPGDTIHTVLRHVSRSGMQREIGVVLIDKDGDCIQPDYLVANAISARIGKHDGLIMGGCGMDMGFALVYELSARLFPDGFGCIGDRTETRRACPSNDHSNDDRDYTPHNTALVAELEMNKVSSKITANHWHREGGYALRQVWL